MRRRRWPGRRASLARRCRPRHRFGRRALLHAVLRDNRTRACSHPAPDPAAPRTAPTYPLAITRPDAQKSTLSGAESPSPARPCSASDNIPGLQGARPASARRRLRGSRLRGRRRRSRRRRRLSRRSRAAGRGRRSRGCRVHELDSRHDSGPVTGLGPALLQALRRVTETELVVTRRQIQRHLERRRGIARDHTPDTREVDLVRRRSHRHPPHRPRATTSPVFKLLDHEGLSPAPRPL